MVVATPSQSTKAHVPAAALSYIQAYLASSALNAPHRANLREAYPTRIGQLRTLDETARSSTEHHDAVKLTVKKTLTLPTWKNESTSLLHDFGEVFCRSHFCSTAESGTLGP